MKKSQPTKNYPLYTVVFLAAVFLMGYLTLEFLHQQSGDLDSVCEAKIENAHISELTWSNGPTTFYFIDYRGIVSQRSDTEQDTVVVPGVVNTLYVAEKIGKLAFLEANTLWTVNLDGTEKTEILSFPEGPVPSILGLSKNNQVVLIRQGLVTIENGEVKPPLFAVNLLTKKSEVTGPSSDDIEKYEIKQLVHDNTSLSPDGTKNIELIGGKFVVAGRELFHCGIVRGSVGPSGPACFRHNWLADNDHIVLELCGTYIVEVSTGKVARINGVKDVDWLGEVE